MIEKLIDDYKGEKTFYDGELLGAFFTLSHLEAFAKAYAQQQSEPVWVLSRDNKGRTTNFISGFPTKFDISKLPDGTELFITPPATVPLEKYNKVLDAFKKARQTLEGENNESLSAINDTIWMQEGSETLFDFMNSAIAEAERKE